MRLAYLSVQAVRADEAAGAHVHGIVDGLRALGWEVDLFLPSYRSPDATPARRVLALVANGMRVLSRADHYDVVYVRGSVFAWPFALLARLRRAVVVHELNGPIEEVFVTWPSTRRLPRIIRWLGASQLRWSSGAIGVTPQLTASARELGAPAAATIPNGADVDLFTPGLPARPGLPPAYAVFFGQLAPWQGIATMLQAAASDLWPDDLALVIAGDGAERGLVETAAQATPRIAYLGPVSRPELAAVVSNATLGISVQEGIAGRERSGVSPIKLFEMMAAGIPVVVSTVAGLDALVVESGCGVVVDAGNAGDLARAVAGLARHPDRVAIGARGRVAVERSHSWLERAAATDRFLRSLAT